MAITNNTFSSAFDVWGRRSPSYEKHFENSVIKPLADFGIGTNEASDAKGKVLGAGYEVLIMAFFIGLYSNKRIPLNTEEEIKDLRQQIQYWGSIESRKGRRSYPRLKDYIFTALVARTPDVEWLELDKGNKTVSECVNLLINTMEEYINYGLSFMEEKINEDAGYFYDKNAFLDIFRQLTVPQDGEQSSPDESDAPEPLD